MNRHKVPPVPSPIRTKPIAKPSIRPEVKRFLDEIVPSLTEHERQYLIQKIGQRFIQHLNSQRMNPAIYPSRPSRLPVNPHLREVVEDLKKVEEYVTMGFPPPKAIVPLQKKRDNKELYAVLDYILNRLDNSKLSDQLCDFVADALGAIAEKIEGGK